MVLIIICRYK